MIKLDQDGNVDTPKVQISVKRGLQKKKHPTIEDRPPTLTSSIHGNVQTTHGRRIQKKARLLSLMRLEPSCKPHLGTLSDQLKRVP
jgi:hypothetical protein